MQFLQNVGKKSLWTLFLLILLRNTGQVKSISYIGYLKSPVPLKNSIYMQKNILLCLTLWHRHPLNLIWSESNQI